MAKATEKDLAAQAKLLADIVLMTKNGQLHFVTDAEAKPLVDAGLIEVNHGVTQDGKIAARATEKGLEQGAGAVVEVATPKPVTVRPSFGIVTDAPIPQTHRSAGRGDMYPWEQLAAANVGAAFFVAATEEKPKPAISISSAVTAANKRFEDRKIKFRVFAIDDGAKYGYAGVSGAAVHRVDFVEKTV